MTTVTAPKMSEADLQAAVIELARWKGYLVYHTYDSRRSQPGYPDLTICGHGRLIFAELKSDTGRTTKAQDEWLMTLDLAAERAKVGCNVPPVEVYVWRPADLRSGAIAEVLSR